MPSTFNPHAVCHFLLASATLLAAGATAAPRLLPAQAGDLAPNTLSAPLPKPHPTSNASRSP